MIQKHWQMQARHFNPTLWNELSCLQSFPSHEVMRNLLKTLRNGPLPWKDTKQEPLTVHNLCSNLLRILQPQTESGPRNHVFIFRFVFRVSFLFHIILRSCESIIFIFDSPILWKCHSHLFIVFPSCAVDIIMFIRVPFLHFAIMYLSFRTENESKQNQKRKILYNIDNIYQMRNWIKWKEKTTAKLKKTHIP